MQRDEMRRVVLRDFPIRTMHRAQQHADALLREFQVIAHSADGDGVPARLLELAEVSSKRNAGLNPHADDVIDEALARGAYFVDLELWVPVTFRDETLEAVPVLLEVEEYCRSGQMLTLVPSDEIRSFWAWYLGEFVRQSDGEAPQSWLDWSQSNAGRPAE